MSTPLLRPVPCNRTPRGGRRVGPTVGAPSYELALNGDMRVAVAAWDVATWPDRVHQRATVLAAAKAQP